MREDLDTAGIDVVDSWLGLAYTQSPACVRLDIARLKVLPLCKPHSSTDTLQ